MIETSGYQRPLKLPTARKYLNLSFMATCFSWVEIILFSTTSKLVVAQLSWKLVLVELQRMKELRKKRMVFQ